MKFILLCIYLEMKSLIFEEYNRLYIYCNLELILMTVLLCSCNRSSWSSPFVFCTCSITHETHLELFVVFKEGWQNSKIMLINECERFLWWKEVVFFFYFVCTWLNLQSFLLERLALQLWTLRPRAQTHYISTVAIITAR